MTVMNLPHDLENSPRESNNPTTSGLSPMATLPETESDQMELELYLIQSLTPREDRPEAKFKISLKNISKREVHLPKDRFPLYPLNLQGFEVLEDGSKKRLDRPSWKSKPLDLYELSPLQVGQCREYEIGDLASFFKLKFGRQYELKFQLRAIVGHGGIVYHLVSNIVTIKLSWPIKAEQNLNLLASSSASSDLV